MADIDIYLQRIMEAVYGEEVRGSIHDAIDMINKTSEVCISVGTDITGPTSSSEGYYKKSMYLNDNTWDLWQCTGTNAWTKLGNIKGEPGKGIVSITKTGTTGLTDTYTITYTDDTTSTFTVKNGRSITSIVLESTTGLVDTYKVTFNDDTDMTFDVTNGAPGADGVSVTGVVLFKTVGRVKTYRMSFSDGTHFDYDVEDGASGTGTGDMTKAVYDKNDDGVVDELASIDDIDDVDTSTSTPRDSDVLEYDGTDEKWENKQPEHTYDPTSKRVISGQGVANALDGILGQMVKGTLEINSYLVTATGDRLIAAAGNDIIAPQVIKLDRI